MLQSLEFMLKCSHMYNLVRKKKNTKVLTYALDNIHIIFIVLWLCSWAKYLVLK